MAQKAVIEIDLPSSCRNCKIVFMYEKEDSGKPYCYGCGYLQSEGAGDITKHTDRRHEKCPLKITGGEK